MNTVIASNLEKIAKKESITYKRLADIMGISRGTLNKILNHKQDIKWSQMTRLRLELGVDLNDLVLDDYKVVKPHTTDIMDTKYAQLISDFWSYDIEKDELIKLILKKIFNAYLNRKSFFEKMLQGNRIVIDFAVILYNMKLEKGEFAKKNNSKELLIKKIKNSKIKIFEKYIKRGILKRLKILSEKDCFYILTFNKWGAKILLDSIPIYDKKLLKKIGYKKLLSDFDY